MSYELYFGFPVKDKKKRSGVIARFPGPLFCEREVSNEKAYALKKTAETKKL
jgi:hypothetical protein